MKYFLRLTSILKLMTLRYNLKQGHLQYSPCLLLRTLETVLWVNMWWSLCRRKHRFYRIQGIPQCESLRRSGPSCLSFLPPGCYLKHAPARVRAQQMLPFQARHAWDFEKKQKNQQTDPCKSCCFRSCIL